MKHKKMILVGLIAAVVAVLAACGSSSDSAYPNSDLLVDVAWLEEHLNDDKLIVLDARSSGYDEGHVPGAVHFSSGKLNDPENEVSGFLHGADTMTDLFQSAGVNEDSTVVVYDGGNAMSASRVFYALEYYGLQDQVKVLNGGFPAWLTAGKDVSVDAVTPDKGNFVAAANDALVYSREEALSNLENEKVVFFDVRSEAEYTGENPRNNAKGGHIPGAVNLEWSKVMTENEDGVQVFRSFDEVKKDFEHVGVVNDKTVVPYCQTNARGAHTYFTLRLLGYSDIQPYEGSWAEWGNREDTPVEK